MYNIISIEGIDRIGKSTFINVLSNELNRHCILGNISVEKPTIGINTLHKDAYPLRNIPGIMEIRNIGLFEELLFQVQQYMALTKQHELPSKCIIRDRFHLSELAYGLVLRPEQFGLFDSDMESGYTRYSKWTRWFEKQLMETGCMIKQITFILSEDSYPNEDEAVAASNLVTINNQFITEHEKCTFPKMLIKLNKNENGMTDIMDYLDEVVSFVLDLDVPKRKLKHVYTKDNKMFIKCGDMNSKMAVINNDIIGNGFWNANVHDFAYWYDMIVKNEKDTYDNVKAKNESFYWFITRTLYEKAWHSIPIFITGDRVAMHLQSATFTLGKYKHDDQKVIFGNGNSYDFETVSSFCVDNYQELLNVYEQTMQIYPDLDVHGFADACVNKALCEYVYTHI